MNPEPSRRLHYLDWVRGLAVLIMIEAHLLDSWTAASDRQTGFFVWGIILGGFGAPLFLLLAGVSVSMSAARKLRGSNSVAAAAVAVMRRGVDIFLLAFLFRAQALLLGWGSPRTLLRVDILNIMGPSIVAAAALWGTFSTLGGRAAAFVAATVAMALLTPVIGAASWPAMVPDPIEAYFRPVAGLTSFAFLPWTGFVFAGALIGMLVDRARTPGSELRVNAVLAAGGLLTAAVAYAASFLPTPFARSDFWTSSPSFFFLRLGLLVAMVPLGYLWMSRRRGQEKWSPLQQLGRSSLFIYWIHVELVYGLISLKIHRALTLPQALVALVLLTALMLLCSIGKDRIVTWWKASRPTPQRA